MDIEKEMKDFDNKWLDFMRKMKEDYPDLENVVIIQDEIMIDASRMSPLDLGALESRVLGFFGKFSVPTNFGRLSSFNNLEQHYTPKPGEEIGSVKGNSRKKVVASVSGFPYPVPQQSKKRK